MLKQRINTEGAFDELNTSRLPDISQMSLTDLLMLRDRINARLPANSLKDLDLESELVYQFIQAKEVLRTISEDDEIGANQKSQMVNAVSSIITQISRLQTELYSSERVKHMESTLIKTMKGQPEEIREQFMSEYQRRLKQTQEHTHI